jgi:Tol biopolymer transport system component
MYFMQSDGSGVTQVAGSTAADNEPQASSDGRSIVFSSMRGLAEIHVFIINRDGSGFAQLTDDGGFQDGPHFSPDGRMIVYAHNWRIRVMNVEGTGKRDITPPNSGDRAPNFLPDGRRIAFWRTNHDMGETRLHIINLDGTGEVSFAVVSANQFTAPVFSPDGTTAYFASGGAEVQVWTMNVNTGELRNLSNSAYSDCEPVVVQNKLVFPSNRTGKLELFSANLDGSNAINLTNTPSSNEAFWGATLSFGAAVSSAH